MAGTAHTRIVRRGGAAAAGVVIAAALAGCATSPASDPGAEVLVSGLDAPWSVVVHDGAVLVSERDSARVLEIVDGAAVEVGIIADVVHGGEGGLLGLAVHDGELYSYSTSAGGNRVERRDILGESGSLSLGEATAVIDGIPAARTHNGGRLAFGPDGMLYITTGDAGDRESAQDPAALSGKILRVAPDGGIPADNPVAGSPVYTSGHRNPQGIGWDADGTMYATEFGQDTWDELNVIEAGANYGWPEVEGSAGDPRFVDPVQQWRPSEASPSGLAVTQTQILIASLRGEMLRRVPLDRLNESLDPLATGYGRLRDVIVVDGEIWVLTNETDGRGDPAADDDRLIVLPGE